MKVALKRKQYVTNTFVSRKSKEKIKQEIRQRVKEIQQNTSHKLIMNYNSYILGVRNYYETATHVSVDFADIHYQTLKTLYNRLKSVANYGVPRSPPPLYKKLFRNNYRTFTIKGVSLFPLADVQWKKTMTFNNKMCNYTKDGRTLVYKKLEGYITKEINYLLNIPYETGRMEYMDNRISKYSGQRGRCAVSQCFLIARETHCHHITPISQGGTDEFNNLIIVHEDMHRLIHATREETIKKLLSKFNLNKKQMKKLNKLRKKCNLTEINF